MVKKQINLEFSPRPSTIHLLINKGTGLVGVELGVDKGYNAFSLYTLLQPKELYLVDCWDNFIDYDSGEIIGEAQYQTALSILKTLPNIHIIRKKSSEAVKQFEDNSLDFVYIDAGHQYEMVRQDLELWYQKVKNGGFFCGHDFDINAGSGGVVKALHEFVDKIQKNAKIVQTDWIINK
jgi:hypothetical protein